MSANQADANNALSVRGMCRVLNVSPSGYYDWLHRPPSARMLANLVLTEAIRKAHKDSDENLRHAQGARRAARGPPSAANGWRT